MPRLSWTDTQQLCSSALEGIGYSAAEADRVTEHLLAAEAAGLTALGLARVAWIAEIVSAGHAVGDRSNIVSAGTGHVKVDGCGSLGYLAVETALEAAVPLARANGVAVATVNNVFLTGVLRVYGGRLAEKGLACVMTSSAAPAIVVPPGGKSPALGTNPIAIAVPDWSGRPLVFDTSSTSIPYSELKTRALHKKPLPLGVAVDQDGKPTTDATSAMKGGLLAWAGHRGYGMALAVASLGMLAGAPAKAETLSDCGFVGLIFDPRKIGADVADLAKLRDAIALSMAQPDAQLPGDRWREAQSKARREGVAVSDKIWHALEALQST